MATRQSPLPSSATVAASRSVDSNGTREVIIVAGILLLAFFVFGLVVGLVQFARSYYLTPSRDPALAFDRRRWVQYEILNFATMVAPGNEELHPPPPAYFPRPPSYETCCSPKDDTRIDWPRTPASSRRHSV